MRVIDYAPSMNLTLTLIGDARSPNHVHIVLERGGVSEQKISRLELQSLLREIAENADLISNIREGNVITFNLEKTSIDAQ